MFTFVEFRIKSTNSSAEAVASRSISAGETLAVSRVRVGSAIWEMDNMLIEARGKKFGSIKIKGSLLIRLEKLALNRE